MHDAIDDRLRNGSDTDRKGNDCSTDALPGEGAARLLADAIAAAGAMLRLAAGLAAAGRPIDLAGLDDRLGRLCAQALDLPAAEGAGLRAALIALLRDLDALDAALRRP